MSPFVRMPALGESDTEGTVTRWLKNVGDQVEVDEPLVEVSTDKVDTEIPSPFSGVLEKITVGEGDIAAVGAELGVIGDGSGDLVGEDEIAAVGAELAVNGGGHGDAAPRRGRSRRQRSRRSGRARR